VLGTTIKAGVWAYPNLAGWHIGDIQTNFTPSVSVQQKHSTITNPNIETFIADGLASFAIQQPYDDLILLSLA
jgi:hypothetical protein